MTILLSLLAAVALAAGGYGVMLDWRRAPIPTGDAKATPAPLFTLPEVTRLERLLEAAPAAAQGSRPPAFARLAIELADAAAAGLPDTAGVAVIAADTGAQLEWLPLASFQAHGDTVRAEIDAPAMPLRLCFAARPTAALRSWWTQQPCAVAASGTTVVGLDAKAHAVTVAVVSRGDQAPQSRRQFALRRVGVADWHYATDNGGVAIVSDIDGRLLLTLGAGDYELLPLLDATDETFALHVPVTGPVRAEFTR